MAPPDDIRPMLARLADGLSDGPGWLYEPKWDGFRCILNVETDGAVRLLSRRGTPLNNAFPDIVAAATKQLPAGTIADGGNRALVDHRPAGLRSPPTPEPQRRPGTQNLARTEPCHLVLFGLLQLQDKDLTGSLLTQRRAELEQLLDDTGAAVLVAGMQTDDAEVARAWFDQLAAVGVEGIVAKRADEPYRPGTRSWVIVGRSTELHPTAAEQIAAAITPAGNEHPWPAQLPPSWHNRQARDYHRVTPDLVVEIRVDVATTHDIEGPSNWRHRLRLLGLRTDLDTSDVPQDLRIERHDS